MAGWLTTRSGEEYVKSTSASHDGQLSVMCQCIKEVTIVIRNKCQTVLQGEERKGRERLIQQPSEVHPGDTMSTHHCDEYKKLFEFLVD